MCEAGARWGCDRGCGPHWLGVRGVQIGLLPPLPPPLPCLGCWGRTLLVGHVGGPAVRLGILDVLLEQSSPLIPSYLLQCRTCALARPLLLCSFLFLWLVVLHVDRAMLPLGMLRVFQEEQWSLGGLLVGHMHCPAVTLGSLGVLLEHGCALIIPVVEVSMVLLLG